MNYRELGKSGIAVSEISFGCWTMGGPSWIKGQPVGWGIGITLAASAVLTLGLGVFAEPLLQLAAF